MSGILKRTIFIDPHKKNGSTYHKFWDWAMVVTGIGAMAEPFQAGQKYPIQTNLAQDYDPEDEMARVDEIIFAEHNQKLLSGQDNPPHMGGTLMTRVGR